MYTRPSGHEGYAPRGNFLSLVLLLVANTIPPIKGGTKKKKTGPVALASEHLFTCNVSSRKTMR